MAGKKSITKYWDDDIKKADGLHKGLVAKRNTMLAPLVAGERKAKDLIGDYVAREREERERIERELREEAEKKEKERLLKIAKEEEELKKSEGYLSPEQIAAEQKKIEEANKKEFMPEVKLEKEEAPKGQIIKYNYSAEVVDFEKLPSQYKLANMSKLNVLARSQKNMLNIPGVKLVKNLNVSTR